MGATLAVASVISGLIFHRGLAPITSFGGFITSLISFVIATVGVGLAAGVAALIWTARRADAPGSRSSVAYRTDAAGFSNRREDL
jgi:hypothetical protein